MNAVVKGIDTYRRTIHTLKRKNSKLQAELDSLYEAEDVSIQPRKGKSAGPTVANLQAQVKKLKRENKKLEEVGQSLLFYSQVDEISDSTNTGELRPENWIGGSSERCVRFPSSSVL